MDLVKDQEEILDLLSKVQREGIENLITWLKDSDFFRSPASSSYHSNVVGGLAFHSLKVYELLKKKVEHFGFGKIYDQDTIIICGLMHDLCKVNTYKQDVRNKKIDGAWQQIPYWAVEDRTLPLGHGEKSLFMLQTFINLTVPEALAIRWHMAGFAPEVASFTGQRSFQNTMDTTPLAVMLATSDFEATYLMEEVTK